MRGRARLVWGLMVVLMAVGGVVAAEDVTLNGSFVWEREDDNRTGDLKAIFTPTGDSEWDVTFRFEWEDEDHVYKGTASGSLSDGDLNGAVEGDNEGDHKMSFRFEGSFADGTFTGTHSYLNKEGEAQPSGTLTLEQ